MLAAPRGSTATTAYDSLTIGDMPAVAAVVIGGVVRLTTSRVTPPPMAAVSMRS